MANTEKDHLAYQYDPLPDPSTHIRILQLYPASSEFDLVACSFEVDDVTLASSTATFVVHQPIDDNDAPREYALLSDAAILMVSEDTHFFLQRLRNQPSESLRRVWSPRVCINQMDENEQSLQLGCYPFIYKRALQSMSMTLNYKQELLSSPDSIRVIELDQSGGLSNDLLKTRMRQVSLQDEPTFFYLDIREGLTDDSWPVKTPVLCNRRLLNLPTPLAQILTFVLRSKGPRAFWTPSICHEKGATLDPALDQRIRKHAKEVVGIMQPLYSYAPLPQDRPFIRLLKILPATASDDVLVAEIGHFPLDDSCPSFVALSYVWGSPNPPWMVCTPAGRYIVCTQSLRLALCHLRDRGELIVWADAICINQKDNQEKSKQVLLMGEIYKRASRVVVELGMTCTNEQHLACRKFLQALLGMLSLSARVLQAVRPERTSLQSEEYGKFGIPSYGHQAWGAWRTMRSRPWFTRSWIVQEVTASRNVTLLYNGLSFRWEDIHLANGVTAREQVDSKTYNGKMNIQNMGDLQNTEKGSLPRLLDLLSTFKSLDATDPRDKIYAFRGLASDGDDSPLPDYSKPVADIFVDFASFFVRNGLTGRMLLEAGQHRAVQDIPSWVPDWSNSKSWQTYNYAKGIAWIPLNSLQKQLSLESRDSVTPGSTEGSILHTRVSILDEIDTLSSAVSNTFLYEDVSERARIDNEVLDLYNSAQKMATKLNTTEMNTNSTRTAVQKTVLGGDAKSFVPMDGFYGRSKIIGSIQDDENGTLTAKFDEHLRERLSSRRFCVTKHGRMALVPSISEDGDTIGFVEHVESPFILRHKGNSCYTLIGDAFVLDPNRGHGNEGGALDLKFVDVRIV